MQLFSDVWFTTSYLWFYSAEGISLTGENFQCSPLTSAGAEIPNVAGSFFMVCHQQMQNYYEVTEAHRPHIILGSEPKVLQFYK
jgi:hypothetical protein